MKHDIHYRPSALETTRLFYIISKCHELWSTNGFKLDLNFFPPCVNFAFHFIPSFADGDKHTKLNQTLPNCGQYIALTICRRKVVVVSPPKLGAKNFYICSVFRRFWDLMANIVWNETWHRQSGKGVGKQEGSSTLFEKFMNFGPQTG